MEGLHSNETAFPEYNTIEIEGQEAEESNLGFKFLQLIHKGNDP